MVWEEKVCVKGKFVDSCVSFAYLRTWKGRIYTYWATLARIPLTLQADIATPIPIHSRKPASTHQSKLAGRKQNGLAPKLTSTTNQ